MFKDRWSNIKWILISKWEGKEYERDSENG